MDNFKFNFLSEGQLKSSGIRSCSSNQIITMLWGFIAKLIFANIARMFGVNHLKVYLENKDK